MYMMTNGLEHYCTVNILKLASHIVNSVGMYIFKFLYQTCNLIRCFALINEATPRRPHLPVS